MYNIAVIGSGQIGTRHLQGLALSAEPMQIFVCDPSVNGLAEARNKWNEVAQENGKKNVVFSENYSGLPERLDVCIIATTSLHRKKTIEEILITTKIRFLILEKVLFPSVSDYGKTALLMRNNNVKAFVNCARREFGFYRELRDKFSRDSKIHFTVFGNNFGLGCNGIHFLDLFVYLTGCSDLIMLTPGLDKKIKESKRKGFKEITGTLTGFDACGNTFSISSFEGNPSPVKIIVSSSDRYYYIEEGVEGKFLVSEAGSGWSSVNGLFPVPKISELTGNIVDDLLHAGTCRLTTYDESARIHIPFISAVKDHMEKCLEIQLDYCPVT
ncbi:MAG: Gfo/Idh/MocA family oxidoreductase [Bacteroidetes bacterium]|nr:Gfo/Idh/MocA family oxidoreductase [Bacteroidota bacterium]